jgi:hypothetical protein
MFPCSNQDQFGVNFGGYSGMRFTQGEALTISIVLFDLWTNLPIDLTDAVVNLNLPLQGGGSIKRTTGPVTINSSQVVVPNPPGTPVGYVNLTDHGFVTGDPVQVAVVGGGTLPTPLAPSTNYLIKTIDVNNFEFTDTSGNAISLTTQGSGQFNINNTTDLVIANATMGQVTLTLRSLVTAAANALLAQNFQIGYSNTSTTRIMVLQNLLDVLFQPVP